MKNLFRHHSRFTSFISIILIVFSVVLWTGNTGFQRLNAAEAAGQQDTPAQGNPAVLDKSNPQIQAVMAVQNRHSPQLFTLPEVVGTATGLTDDNVPAVVVFARKAVSPGKIPDKLEEVPVVIQVTGEFYAFKPGNGVGYKGRMKPFSTTSVLPLPVPIGVSAGNENECSSGTIGARVKDSAGAVYALSNNHVFALENEASNYDSNRIFQPGFYDTRCRFRGNNVIGTLAGWVPIVFEGINTVDAAIALTSPDVLENSTPSDGYGTPKSAVVGPVLNAAVQKYGRTTSLTKGTITGINATITVGYISGNAIFENQIIVGSPTPFIKAGDSGSLLVTDPGLNPVGLLFAGDNSGTTAVANPISDVLSSLGVTIDGEPN